MSSAYPGGGGTDYYGGGGGGRSLASSMAGNNNNSLNPNNLINNNAAANNITAMNQQHSLALLRLQQQRRQQLLQHQHQHQSIGGVLNDPTTATQIGNRRIDFIGKRSLADFQNFSQISQLHPQQNHSPYPVLQQQQQQQQNHQNNPLSLLQHQLSLRSVKQRSNNYLNNTLLTPTYQNHGFDLRSSSLPQEIPSYSSPAATAPARYGVPIYQQRQPVSLNNNNNSDYFGNNGPSLINNNNRTNPVGHRNHNIGDTGSNNGYSNLSPCPTSADEPMPAGNDNINNNKMMDTLQELEKQLLDDNDEEECDAVSVITSSEWSETFQNLMSPAQTPTTPIQTQNPSQNIISPSSTSSTSSSCSSSASPPAPTVPSIQLITEAATAISEGKTESAVEILSRLSQLGNPIGNSEQKLVAYMSNALRSRACPKEYPPPVMELFSKEHMESMYMLHDLSLCYKFGWFAANLVILEAVTAARQEKSRVHVIDFDIGHGGQYMNLLGALGERQVQSGGCNNVELKITAVTTELVNSGGSIMGADVVKEGIMKTAERVGVNLRFNTVSQSIRDITPESLGCEEGESVLVNFAFKLHRVPDESVSMENLRDELLRRVKGLKPRVVTLVEQEMNGNTAPFMTRVNECVAYYGALFDSLESGLTRDNQERGRVEEGLGRKMMNSVACEGRDRVERCEVYGKWRARMGMAGFELKPLTQSVAESMRTKLNSSEARFTVKEENGGVYFGWMGRALTVASAWR